MDRERSEVVSALSIVFSSLCEIPSELERTADLTKERLIGVCVGGIALATCQTRRPEEGRINWMRERGMNESCWGLAGNSRC